MATPIQSRVDQCKVVWYQWANDIEDSDAAFSIAEVPSDLLSKAKGYDISEHIMECTFTKSMGESAGSFSLTLGSSRDWSRILKPGEWLTIYLSSEGDLPLPNPSDAREVSDNSPSGTLSLVELPAVKQNPIVPGLPTTNVDLANLGNRLRGMCVIQRVAIKSTVSSDGSVSQIYDVTGKDFGACLEETDLWFNFLLADGGKFRTFVEATFGFDVTSPEKNIRNLRTLMDTYFKAFFQPTVLFGSSPVGTPGTLGEKHQQWLLPDEMLSDIGVSVSEASYFGNIAGLQEFHDTLFENNLQSPLAGLQGNAWGKMKALSQPEFHEFFSEIEEDGKPKLHFRPIPWAISKDRYPNVGKLMTDYISLTREEGIGEVTTNLAQDTFTNPLGTVKSAISAESFRKKHNVTVPTEQIFTADVGPDFHNRYNHFLVTAVNEGQRHYSIIANLKNEKKFTDDFPFRNDASVKRHGLRARHFNVESFINTQSKFAQGVLKDSAQKQFILELNEVMRDFWGQAGEFYSGNLSIAGRNDIKLGKVLLTDDNLQAISNFVFYIEAYSDKFTVDTNGTGEWTQTIGVTRGVELEDLKNRSGFGRKAALKKNGSFIKN